MILSDMLPISTMHYIGEQHEVWETSRRVVDASKAQREISLFLLRNPPICRNKMGVFSVSVPTADADNGMVVTC